MFKSCIIKVLFVESDYKKGSIITLNCYTLNVIKDLFTKYLQTQHTTLIFAYYTSNCERDNN